MNNQKNKRKKQQPPPSPPHQPRPHRHRNRNHTHHHAKSPNQRSKNHMINVIVTRFGRFRRATSTFSSSGRAPLLCTVTSLDGHAVRTIRAEDRLVQQRKQLLPGRSKPTAAPYISGPTRQYVFLHVAESRARLDSFRDGGTNPRAKPSTMSLKGKKLKR